MEFVFVDKGGKSQTFDTEHVIGEILSPDHQYLKEGEVIHIRHENGQWENLSWDDTE